MIIPNERRYYLREISETVRDYHKKVEEQREVATKLYQLEGTKEILGEDADVSAIKQTIEQYEDKLTNESKKLLDSWDETKEAYAKEQMSFQVRDREITVDTVTESLRSEERRVGKE